MILWIAHSLYTRPCQEKLSNARFRHQAIIRVNMVPAVQGHMHITEGLFHVVFKLCRKLALSPV